MSKSEIILACNDAGVFKGEYIPKEVGHTGEGRRHLAIAVLVYNSQGQVLLQRRKHQVFDDIWDVTGATHPLHRENGSDESLEEATWRCLEVEFGIKEKIPLENRGFFNYFAKYGSYCENEHCAMMTGEYNGEVNLNQDVGYEYKWMDKEVFLKDIESDPKNYTPWAVDGINVLKREGFFT